MIMGGGLMAQCSECGINLGLFGGMPVDGKLLCGNCIKKHSDGFQELIKHSKEVKLTTTNNIDGYKVIKYIDIESIEIVIGTGVFVEFTSSFQDFFGARSSGFEKKLADAKKAATDLLRMAAVQKRGNAVIGVDLDYTEFSGNRIGLILNGTIVEIVPETQSLDTKGL
jgi:uncharacterized protein YbjQ (UPF0145 family)